MKKHRLSVPDLHTGEVAVVMQVAPGFDGLAICVEVKRELGLCPAVRVKECEFVILHVHAPRRPALRLNQFIKSLVADYYCQTAKEGL